MKTDVKKISFVEKDDLKQYDKKIIASNSKYRIKNSDAKDQSL